MPPITCASMYTVRSMSTEQVERAGQLLVDDVRSSLADSFTHEVAVECDRVRNDLCALWSQYGEGLIGDGFIRWRDPAALGGSSDVAEALHTHFFPLGTTAWGDVLALRPEGFVRTVSPQESSDHNQTNTTDDSIAPPPQTTMWCMAMPRHNTIIDIQAPDVAGLLTFLEGAPGRQKVLRVGPWEHVAEHVGIVPLHQCVRATSQYSWSAPQSPESWKVVDLDDYWLRVSVLASRPDHDAN